LIFQLLEYAAIAIAAILLRFLGGKLAFWLKNRRGFDYEVRTVAKEWAKQARKEYGAKFDFSRESIQRVEKILGELHETHVEKPWSEEELAAFSLRWGAYVGEVLKRVHPGKWQRDSEKIGPGTMPVVFSSGAQAFPRSWVHKRIVEGSGDNIAFKFDVVCQEKF
jgi:hypothetical protein